MSYLNCSTKKLIFITDKCNHLLVFWLLLISLFIICESSFAAINFRSASTNGIATLNSGSITIAAGGFRNRTNCGSITPPIPTGNNGDLLIAQVIAREDGATVTLSGWNTLFSQNVSGEDYQAILFWKVANGSDSNIITQTGTCDHLMGRISRYGNVDPSQPLETQPLTSTNWDYSDADNVDTGTQSISIADSMLILATFVADDRRTSEPGSFTQLYDRKDNSSRDGAISLNYRNEASTGTTGPFNNMDLQANGSDPNHGVLFAIRPSTSGLTITVPTGTTTDDIMIASIAWRLNSPSIVPPSGWTLIRETNQSSGGASNRLATYRRTASSSEPASYSWSFSGGTFSGAVGGISSFSGVDTSSPINIEGGNTTSNSFSHTANSITTTIADSMIISTHEFPSATSGWTAPSGMTEIVDNTSIPSPDTLGVAISMNYTSQSSIAPTGNKTAIASSSSTDSGSGAAHILALTPLVNNTFDPANYSYNEQLSITTGPTGPDKRYNGYTVRLASFNTQSLISAGKLQPDCDDLRVVHDDNGTLVEVDRHLISCNDSSSDIRFMLQADIADSTTDTNYYLYYGNPSANAPNPVTTTNVYRWYDDTSIDRSGDYTHGRIDAWHGSDWDDSLSWDSAGYYSYNTGDNYSSGYRIAVDERDALIEAEFYHTGCYNSNMTTGVLLRGQIDSGSNGNESSSHYYATNRGHNASCGSGYNQDGDIVKSSRTTTAVDGTDPDAITNNQWRKMALSVWGINSTTLNFWDNNAGWPALAWPDAGSLHISGTDSDYDGRGFAAIMTAQDKARVRNIVVRRYVESEPVVSIISSTAVDHYAITYPLGNPGITCEANAFTITAHDANHLAIAPTSSTQITIGASMPVDGVTLKSGNGTFTAPDKYTFDGTETSAQFWLRRSTITASPHIDIDISDGTATDNDGDAGEDVNAQYVDTGFRFFDDTTGSTESINHQIAGKPSNTQPNSQTLQLRAVKTNSTTQACEVALQGNTAVELAYECNNPSTCINNDLVQISAAENKFIARNNNASVSSYTSVNMSFDTNGIAPFSFYYNDAGNITLYARKILSTDNTKTPPTTAATLLGASNQFNVRPFGFYMNNLSTATDATSGNIFAKAGNDFTTSLTAKAWASGEDANVDGIPDDHDALSNNLTTENFGHETSSQAVSLTHSKISPTGSGTNTGLLGGNTAQTAGGGSSDFNAGIASNVTLNWNEVGIISLTATLSNYLSSGLTTTSTTNNIGRFIPHHFDINANTPDFANSCTLFTYLGQNFYYGTAPALTVTAQAKLNSTTVNYGGGLGGTNGYWKLNSFLTRSFSEGSPSAPSATLSVSTAGIITLSGETDFDGSGTISQASGSSGDEFTYSKNGVELPFDADVDIIYSAATLTDSDGSCYDPDNNLSCDPYSIEISNNTSVSTELRYGRMVLFDAYGSELNPLKLPLTLEYWQSVDGNNTYTLASDDTCTSLSSSDVIFSDFSGNLSSGETNVISPITLTSGKGNLTLSAPGNNNGGSVCVEYDLVSSNQSWLQDTWSCSSKSSSNPLGKAQFGIFPGNSRQIYMREQY